jgi:hypothetical protein
MIRDRLKQLSTMARSFVGTNGMSAQLTAMNAKLDQLGRATPVEAAAAPQVDFNMMLHQSRGAMLREMPPGAHRLLSAGCAGNWYFDWIAQCYGHVPEHVGIEFYTLQPETLPDNVTWIANTWRPSNPPAAIWCFPARTWSICGATRSRASWSRPPAC